MSAPASQTSMCNGALVHLGESGRIGSINDGSPLAKTFLAVWDQARDEVLVDHPWNFAVKREALAASADFVPQGSQYATAYELPRDCLRWLPWRQGHPDYFSGEQEGNFILSNADAPIARYIGQVENVLNWSVGFRTAMTAKLAAKTAKAITGQSRMVDKMEALYETELSKGKRQDGAATGERSRQLSAQSSWLGARNAPYGR